jgi:hypothetical protein
MLLSLLPLMYILQLGRKGPHTQIRKLVLFLLDQIPLKTLQLAVMRQYTFLMSLVFKSVRKTGCLPSFMCAPSLSRSL